MAGGTDGDPVVTWEATDRGASCAGGCTVLVSLLVGFGAGVWSLWGGVWWAIIGAVPLLTGAGCCCGYAHRRAGAGRLASICSDVQCG